MSENLSKKKNDIRCAICGTEFISSELKEKNIRECPNCKTTIKPLRISEDGYIKLNWQDIRVLAIYAQRWANTFDTRIQGNKEAVIALDVIISKLENYKPKNGGPLDPTYNTKADEKGIPSPYFKK